MKKLTATPSPHYNRYLPSPQNHDEFPRATCDKPQAQHPLTPRCDTLAHFPMFWGVSHVAGVMVKGRGALRLTADHQGSIRSFGPELKIRE